MGRLLLLLVALLSSCSTTPARRSPPTAENPPTSVPTTWLAPDPAWPVRVSIAPHDFSELAAQSAWLQPNVQLPVVSVALALPIPELPRAIVLPLQAAPASPRLRLTPLPPVALKPVAVAAVTLAPVTVAPVTVAPVTASPTVNASPVAGAPVSPATQAVATPSKTPPANATPQPAATLGPIPKPSAGLPAMVDPFQVPSLLPGAVLQAQDFNWTDMNITAGEVLSLQFPKTNWLYLDSPAQQKILGYQSATREKETATFAFKPSLTGQYILEFQRQDLATGSTETRHVRLKVALAGTKTASSQSPQTTSDVLEASKALASSGKTAEALQKLLQNYKEQDTRANLEIARLLNATSQTDEALGFLDKNLTQETPDLRDSLLLGTQLALAKNPSQKLPSYVKQWLLSNTPPPEDLYLAVLTGLRDQKLSSQARDWLKVYSLWYKAPQAKDQYLYLAGTLFESPGELLNIKDAYKAYTEVVEKYPLSTWWKASGERASYLNRHFLQVR